MPFALHRVDRLLYNPGSPAYLSPRLFLSPPLLPPARLGPVTPPLQRGPSRPSAPLGRRPRWLHQSRPGPHGPACPALRAYPGPPGRAGPARRSGPRPRLTPLRPACPVGPRSPVRPAARTDRCGRPPPPLHATLQDRKGAHVNMHIRHAQKHARTCTHAHTRTNAHTRTHERRCIHRHLNTHKHKQMQVYTNVFCAP